MLWRTRVNKTTVEDQAEFLATHWMSVGQLEKAGESNCLFSGAVLDYMQLGVPCRRGPFVEHEKQLIDEAIKRYQKVFGSFKN